MSDYTTTDYNEIKELLDYPKKLNQNLHGIQKDTSDVVVSKEPI